MSITIDKLTLKEYPEELQPRERLDKYGVRALSDRELIAILLTTGSTKKTALEIAEQVLTRHNGLRGILDISLEELSSFDGIGIAKASRIISAVEIGKRISLKGQEFKPTIKSPEDVANLLMEKMRYLDREHFKVILLNTKGQVIKCETISIGTLNSSLVHPRELFKIAIRRSAASIILVHNHPSGDTSPSREDIQVTKKIMEAGKLLDIKVLDHIIIGDKSFLSLKEKALI
ncbi:DNA replication and repair protein RadC [Desulfonispora thiosulfatigenes DSM 11270]|uniref:DNA replication and repair protein RadC n=1 Tax=Desulfonispora thiosulfatigenes DSM 11270 TaxID=656914 RepID=A0A1W1VFK8_DESTI|nr:DNA repair protein RadC [Desulfonispora thiosulfatigenes]SMB92142.1 DNA replication and repair protein RadC [Desulfonispora thiosulfatigenes DSM 11270]